VVFVRGALFDPCNRGLVDIFVPGGVGEKRDPGKLRGRPADLEELAHCSVGIGDENRYRPVLRGVRSLRLALIGRAC